MREWFVEFMTFMSGVDDDVMELGVFTSPTPGGTKNLSSHHWDVQSLRKAVSILGEYPEPT